jgi:hypothetical protein
MGPGYSNLTDTNGVVTKSYPASLGDYRVAFPVCYNFAAGVSKVFSIRGT